MIVVACTAARAGSATVLCVWTQNNVDGIVGVATYMYD